MKIQICTPMYGGQSNDLYGQSRLRTLVEGWSEGHEIGIYSTTNESNIRRARNTCAAAFLNSPEKFEKLFFIDADIGFSYEQFKKLILSDKPIISGATPLKTYPLQFNFNPKMGLAELRGSEPEIKIKNVGASFLCISRQVFETLKPNVDIYNSKDLLTGKAEVHHDFFWEGVQDNDYLTEDYGFLHLAKRAGFDTWLRTDVIVKHGGFHVFQTHEW